MNNLEARLGPSVSRKESTLPSESTLFCNAMSDGARTQIVGKLMDGSALPASAIANALRMSPQATRFHLRILEDAGLIIARSCGRHRYYEIASPATAEKLESIFGLVAPPELPSLGPATSRFAEARCCYQHLAGSIAVELAAALEGAGHITNTGDHFRLEQKGQDLFRQLGILTGGEGNARLTGKRCIDVSHRRGHIGGALGASILSWMLKKDWLRKQASERAFVIPPHGRTEIRQLIRSV
jgi:DNA-binding transcriptional ArsR family regulator